MPGVSRERSCRFPPSSGLAPRRGNARCAARRARLFRHSLRGYGADWPISWEEMWSYYGIAERQINVSGPLTYPWGPTRPRYPYRAHQAEHRRQTACEGLRGDRHRLDRDAACTTLSHPHAEAGGKKSAVRLSPGFCRFGCLDQRRNARRLLFGFRARSAAGAEVARSRDGRAN